ncbi:MAG: hypothetical protein WC460_05875 [Patescibacteria group bacterium]
MNSEKPKFNIQIIDEGKKKTDSEASDYLEGYASVKNENELEKDPQFIKFFTKAKEIVTDLANNYGVKPLDIKLEMLHLLPREDFIKESNEQVGAFYRSGGIYVNEQRYKKWDELTKLMIFCHELLHASSNQKTRIKRNKEQFELKNLKVGLRVDLNEPDFQGLNEAMTVFLTNVCYFDYVKDKIELPVSAPSLAIENLSNKEKFDCYKSFENLFFDLCRKLAMLNSTIYESEEPIIREFIRVYFNGGIEKIAKLIMSLGKGALNNLAKINASADEENLIRIINFRKKYGLPADEELNKNVVSLKNKII